MITLMQPQKRYLPIIFRAVPRLVWVLAACWAATANSAAPMHFSQLSLESGLSQNTVLCMLQDSQGFMWIGTENGLNRYDGNAVIRYFHDPQNPDSIGNDYIWDIAEDRDGNLWLATNGPGVQKWTRARNTFLAIDLPSGGSGQSISSSSIATSPNGSIWIGTLAHGLFVIDAGSDTESPKSLFSTGQDSWTGIRSIRFGASNLAFVSTDQGLMQIDSSTFEFIGEFDIEGSEPSGRVPSSQIKNVVAPDLDRGVWVASRAHGLFLFGHASPSTTPEFRQNYTPQLKGSVAQTVFVDSSGRVWVGTQAGLLLYNSVTDQFERYVHDPARPTSLASNYVLSIYEDRGGLIWVGTRGGGTSRWNPRTWSLGETTHPILDGAVINAFAPRADGQTWIGTIGSGLVLHDEKTDAYTRFSRANGFADLADQRIMSLLATGDNDLWIGTLAGGLYRYNMADQSLRNFRRDDTAESIGANGIMSLFASADGTVWAGTFGGGMAEIDPASNSVQRYSYRPEDPTAVPSSRVTAFADADENARHLWVGTLHGGLARLDRETGQFTRMTATGTGLDDGTVYALHHGNDGALWAGTAGGGLVRLTSSVAQPQFESWSTPQGFSSNVIYGIQPDADGQLWLSSNDGLMRFDPSTGATEHFHRSHGLHGEEFNFNAHARRDDGKLYFGGSGGFNAFLPAHVQRNAEPPKLALTSVELFNEPADLGSPYPQLNRLALNHADDVITFEFAALDFAAPENNRFSYRLDGFDRNWSLPANRQRATYTNLDAGDYTFRVRAANSDGTWTPEDQELRVAVSVTPPPWGTWWAYTLYALVLGLLIWAFVRSRVRKVEAAARLRQLKFYDRTTGLPNRELFEQQLTHNMQECTPGEYDLTVLCMQVFGLREAVEALGFEITNTVMTTVATRVSQVLSSQQAGIGDTGLARLGDQTLLLMVRTRQATTDSLRISEALIDATSQPIATPLQDISLDPAVGIATYSDNELDAAQFINNAVLASNEARTQPTGIAHYADAMSIAARDRIALERDLAAALEQDTLALHVQPKHDANDSLIGGEALLRWHHPTRGWINPAEFVAIAEQTRLANTLNEWVVRKAVAIMADWQDRALKPVPLAINVSSHEYVSGRIVHLLKSNAQDKGVDPALIEVEITESVLLRDLEAVEACLDALHAQGHSIALDDFGTGYSSMQYLQRLSIDKIKIDRSFVEKVESQADQAAICQAIIALANALGMRTVAEGVEDRQQRDALLQMGCDEFQGFYYSQAVPPADFAAMLSPA